MKQNKIIGITGGIACGKSVVTNYLKEKKFKVIDADKIAREVVKKGKEGYDKIVDYFGKKILKKDQSLDRKKLRHIVFNNKNKLKKLEEITHPLIIDDILFKIKKFQSQENIIFLDCPLLFEMNLDYLVDETWVISTSKKNQINRLIKRDNTTKEEGLKIINSQMDLKIKEKKADIVLENNYSINDLKEKVDFLLSERV
ncbi:MAG: dephospho-CoA kinase [Bacillota bacterium]